MSSQALFTADTDRSTTWGTATVVALMVAALTLVAYLVWYVPIAHAKHEQPEITRPLAAGSEGSQAKEKETSQK